MYDGIPLLSKWITIDMNRNNNNNNIHLTNYRSSREMLSSSIDVDVVVNKITVELLSANAPFGAYVTHGSYAFGAAPLMITSTDQAHGAVCTWQDDWNADHDKIPGCPDCKDEGGVEPLLNCTYTIGPGAHVGVEESFISFKAFELVTDSTDIERQMLSKHRVTALLAPHTTENPIFFHATDVIGKGFNDTVDKLAETGFEMLIYSFGTNFVFENENNEYLDMIKGQVEYAKSKGIEVGGYDLICLDRGKDGYGGNVGDEWDVVGADGTLTADACFASGWGDKITNITLNFIKHTGLSMLGINIFL